MKTLLVVLTGWMVVSLLLPLTTSGTGAGRPCALSIPPKVADGWWVEMDACALPASIEWRRTVRPNLDEWERGSRWRQENIRCRDETERVVGSGRSLHRKEDTYADRYRFSRFG